MKTIKTCATVVVGLTVTLLALACVGMAANDGSATALKERTCRGTIAAVDVPDKTLAVKRFGFTRTLNIAGDCTVSFEDKPQGTLAELRPGQRVEVHYVKAQGVPVAQRIVQHNLTTTGYITALARADRTLTLKRGWLPHKFVLAENCPVAIKDNRPGSLEDLSIGHTVTVVYESQNGTRTARRIQQESDTFVGTVRAIDAETRTVKAERMMKERKFNLARGCKIVVNGKPTGSLRDLRIGDRVSFSYDDVDGVLVANRLGTTTAATDLAEPEPAAELSQVSDREK